MAPDEDKTTQEPSEKEKVAAIREVKIGTSLCTTVFSEDEEKFGAYHHYIIVNTETGQHLSVVDFQEGPVKEKGVIGVHNEDLIVIVIDRLQSFQNTDFRCEENAAAIHHLEAALKILGNRTAKRRQRGVEGTSTV